MSIQGSRNPLDIPEILLGVFYYLDEWDLRKVRQVNRLWNALAGLATSQKLTVELSTDDLEDQGKLVENVERVQNLCEVLGYPAVQNLRVCGLDMDKKFLDLITTSPFVFLIDLEIQGLSTRDSVVFLLEFPAILPRLKRLSIGISRFEPVPDSFSDVNNNNGGRFAGLKFLKLHAGRQTFFDAWSLVFDACFNLQELWISKDDSDDTVRFLERCWKSYRKQEITTLHLEIFRTGYSQAVSISPAVLSECMVLIGTFPLKSLDVYISGMEHDSWSCLLWQASPSLVKLAMTSDMGSELAGYSADDQQDAAMSFSAGFSFIHDLKALRTLHLVWKGSFDTMYAEDIVLSPGRCHDLSTLVLTYQNVPCDTGCSSTKLGLWKNILSGFPKLTVLELYDGIWTRREFTSVILTLQTLQLERLAITKVEASEEDHVRDEDLMGASKDSCKGLAGITTLKEFLLDANCRLLTDHSMKQSFLTHPSLRIIHFARGIPEKVSVQMQAKLHEALHVRTGNWRAL